MKTTPTEPVRTPTADPVDRLLDAVWMDLAAFRTQPPQGGRA